VVRRRRVGVDEDVEADVAGDVIADRISWRSVCVRDCGMFWKVRGLVRTVRCPKAVESRVRSERREKGGKTSDWLGTESLRGERLDRQLLCYPIGGRVWFRTVLFV
jgi:hypothetical protein